MSLATTLYDHAFELFDAADIHQISNERPLVDGWAPTTPGDAPLIECAVSIQWPVIQIEAPKVDNYSQIFYDFKKGTLNGDITITFIAYNSLYDAALKLLESQVSDKLLPSTSAKRYIIQFKSNDKEYALYGFLYAVSKKQFDRKSSSSLPTFTMTFKPMLKVKNT